MNKTIHKRMTPSGRDQNYDRRAACGWYYKLSWLATYRWRDVTCARCLEKKRAQVVAKRIPAAKGKTEITDERGKR